MRLRDLEPAPYNPRSISPEVRAGLSASLERFGLVEPIIWNSRSRYVVGGHQRLAVMQEKGIAEAQVIVVDLPEKEERALNVALNNLNGEWDYPKLKELLNSLDLNAADKELLGFSESELNSLLKWGQEMSQAPAGIDDEQIGMTPDERKEVYDNNTIKQIVLYFPTEEYILTLKRMKEIMDTMGLETNSEVFKVLLNNWDETHTRPKK